MTTIVKERPRLAGGTDSRRLTYFVKDDANAPLTPAEAVAAVQVAAPASVDGFPFQGYSYEELGTDRYEVEFEYSLSGSSGGGGASPPEGEAYYSFETNLESVKIYKSLGRQLSMFNASLQPGADQSRVNKLFKGAINVDHEGRNQGTTIQVPITRFKYRYKIPGANVTLAYQMEVEELAGKVNSATFKSRAAGSVRFDGARGGVSSDGTWDVEFNFTRRPNVVDLEIGGSGGIQVSADGWDYIWPYFIPMRDDNDEINPEPMYVFVDRIYPRADLNDLGIP